MYVCSTGIDITSGRYRKTSKTTNITPPISEAIAMAIDYQYMRWKERTHFFKCMLEQERERIVLYGSQKSPLTVRFCVGLLDIKSIRITGQRSKRTTKSICWAISGKNSEIK